MLRFYRSDTMDGILTLETADKLPYLKPLQTFMQDERRLCFIVEDTGDGQHTGLICGLHRVLVKKITPRKWIFIHEIEKAQNSFWDYNRYHRKYSRTNLLFYTVTLSNVGQLLLDILNEDTSIICSMEYEKIDAYTQHVRFAIVFPDNYLIKEKHYRIVQKLYEYNLAEYVANCIEFVGYKTAAEML